MLNAKLWQSQHEKISNLRASILLRFDIQRDELVSVWLFDMAAVSAFKK